MALDVARFAGVSQKTVSRVVNDDPHVSADVRERVQEAIAALGYRPNRAARALVEGRSRSIGLLSVGTTDFGPSALMVATERAVRSAGYSLLLVNTLEDEPGTITGALRELLAQNVDGLVVNEPVGAFSLPEGVGDLPVLSLSGQYGISSAEICLDADQTGGARIAVEHLLSLGHRTVHHVSGPATWRSSSLRRDGWENALRDAGAPLPPVRVGDWSAASGYAAGLALAEDPDATAVFAANDQMAIGVVRGLAERGRAVPDDVSVVGFDDIPEAAYLTAALTTVRQDLSAMAALGIRMLVDTIERGPRVARSQDVPVDLVVRETTGAPRRRG